MPADVEEKLIERGRFRPPVERNTVRRDCAGRGFDCQDFVDPPGWEWNGFVHATTARDDPRAHLFEPAAGSTAARELVTVVSGRLRLIVGRQEVIAGPGNEVFIPRNAEHSVHNIHAGTTRWLFGYDR